MMRILDNRAPAKLGILNPESFRGEGTHKPGATSRNTARSAWTVRFLALLGMTE
jgi:hypothetical protein